MEINKSTIRKLADLSKLTFSEKEMYLITQDLSKMVDFINQLEEVDTSEIEPLVHVLSETNHLRDDEIRSMLNQSDALENSPSKDSTYFKLPKVLDKS